MDPKLYRMDAKLYRTFFYRTNGKWPSVWGDHHRGDVNYP